MKEKSELHKRNKHNRGYDFAKLISAYPTLEKYVAPNKYDNLSINFFDPQAVNALNKALLILDYEINYWELPPNSLCPPIPSRADYIHYISDLVGNGNKNVKCLDIGIGASCIYPIIGSSQYGWEFVGSDIDPISLENAQKIIDNNAILKDKIELRLQENAALVFNGIIRPADFFDVTICNPPFHDSLESVKKGSLRKLRNLKGNKTNVLSQNFSGKPNELWCEGGELQFILNMITESAHYRNNCRWFTSLVSKGSNLKAFCRRLEKTKVAEYKIQDMQQGNKVSRILAWRY